MDEIEKKIKYISKEVHESDSNMKSQDCLGQNILSLYIEGSIKEKDKDLVEKHLLECNHCLDFVFLHKKMREAESCQILPDVPKTWIKRAKRLYTAQEVQAGTDFFDIVLKFAEETIEVIKNPGKILISYGAIPLPIRGENESLKTNLVTLSKTFLNIESEVEVEKAGGGYVNIKVTTKEVKSDLPAKGLRISLSNPYRKIASYFAENGEAYFEGLKYGEYVINIIKLRNAVGQISLNIKA
ncbi:MAG: zf-HC2 domain-containing protein [Promethearchaeota archaeon]|jgi:hypothetical protein